MHHSHLDIGYTHPQPLIMELQKDYIDQALNLCLSTADYPEEAKFRWTVEATYPLLRWLEDTSSKKIDLFTELAKTGQIGITALPMHTTPLCNSDQLVRLLHPVKRLREMLGIPIRTAINHDVNGQPWPLSQVLLDAGVEFYITGINIHFGGIPFPRPLVFYWETPDKRKLLTFLGEHYSLFSQFFHTSQADTKLMHQGIQEYVERLEVNGYPYDFIYLTATNPPLFDNNCPDPQLPDLIRKYNEEGHEYIVRFVTPEQLYEKIRERIDEKDIPVHAGDWTDYWNFGSGSSARETRLNRKTKETVKKAEFLEAWQGSPGKRYDNIKRKTLWNMILFDEHTWGAAHSITDPEDTEARSQRIHKSRMAYQAADLSAYLLGKQMEKLANNPLQSTEPEGLVVVNFSNYPQQVELKLPEDMLEKGRHLSDLRIKQFLPYAKDGFKKVRSFGKVDLAPYSWKKIPFKELKKWGTEVENAVDDIRIQDGVIDTPFYTMTFDPKTGRILQLFDKKRKWAMVDETSPWTFFEWVRESIDARKNIEHRSTFFPRDIDLGNKNISVWNHDWKSKREGAFRVSRWDIKQESDLIVFEMELEGPGIKGLTQRIVFSRLHPKIEMEAIIFKEDVRTPESTYFAFPLNLQEDWRCHYDTAGMFVELEKEQMGDVSKDWITVDQTVSIYDGEKGVTLACPDAPLVQVGDFNFGKESKTLPRKKNPLLLAWPMNNYWDTNFWVSQPGLIRFKYVLEPFEQFDPEKAHELGVFATDPIEMNVAVHCPAQEEGRFFEFSGDGVIPLYIKPSQDRKGVVVTVRNLTKVEKSCACKVPGKTIRSAFLVDSLEEKMEELLVMDNQVRLDVVGGGLVHIYIRTEG